MIRDIILDTPTLDDGYYVSKCVIKCVNGKSSLVSDIIADTSIVYYEPPSAAFEAVKDPVFNECYHCGKEIDLTMYT